MHMLKAVSIAAALAALTLTPAVACDLGDYRAAAPQTPVAAAPADPAAPATGTAAAPTASGTVTASPAPAADAAAPTRTADTAAAIPATTKPN